MKRFILFVSIIYWCTSLFAQINSYETWIELGANTDIYKNVSVDLVTETRLQSAGVLCKSISGEIGLSYKITKPLSVGLTFKSTEKNKPQGFFSTQTFSGTIGYKEKLGPLKIGYRNKIEMSKDSYTKSETDMYYEFGDRNRLKLSYGKKGFLIEPSVTIETFHPLSATNYFELTEIRYGGGLDFNLKKKFEAGIGYVKKQSLQSQTIETTHILNISISKSF